MYCPSCSTRKSNTDTQFCTKCGLDLNGLSEYIESGEPAGTLPQGVRSELHTGIKHGLIVALFGLLMIPIWMFIGAAFPANDRLVESSPSTTWQESLAWILMWMALIAGAARIVYALVFESSSKRHDLNGSNVAYLASKQAHKALPAADKFRPADIPIGKWKDSGELLTPKYTEQRSTRDV